MRTTSAMRRRPTPDPAAGAQVQRERDGQRRDQQEQRERARRRRCPSGGRLRRPAAAARRATARMRMSAVTVVERPLDAQARSARCSTIGTHSSSRAGRPRSRRRGPVARARRAGGRRARAPRWSPRSPGAIVDSSTSNRSTAKRTGAIGSTGLIAAARRRPGSGGRGGLRGDGARRRATARPTRRRSRRRVGIGDRRDRVDARLVGAGERDGEPAGRARRRAASPSRRAA